MSWRDRLLILTALVAAALAVWFTPDLLAPLGLGEFGFIGQICLPILLLSLLDLVFRKVKNP